MQAARPGPLLNPRCCGDQRQPCPSHLAQGPTSDCPTPSLRSQPRQRHPPRAGGAHAAAKVSADNRARGPDIPKALPTLAMATSLPQPGVSSHSFMALPRVKCLRSWQQESFVVWCLFFTPPPQILSCGPQALRVAGQTRLLSHPLCTSLELPFFCATTSSWSERPAWPAEL